MWSSSVNWHLAEAMETEIIANLWVYVALVALHLSSYCYLLGAERFSRRLSIYWESLPKRKCLPCKICCVLTVECSSRNRWRSSEMLNWMRMNNKTLVCSGLFTVAVLFHFAACLDYNVIQMSYGVECCHLQIYMIWNGNINTCIFLLALF